MGYDIHITRRENWSDDEGPTITREEWQAILVNNPELEHFNEEDAVWMLDPSRCTGRCFWYTGSKIFVKKPNRAVLMKMLDIAQQLGARVMGDDEEVYSRAGIPAKPAQFPSKEGW